MIKIREQTDSWTTPAAGYEQEVGESILGKRAAQLVYRGCATLPEIGTFAQTPKDFL